MVVIPTELNMCHDWKIYKSIEFLPDRPTSKLIMFSWKAPQPRLYKQHKWNLFAFKIRESTKLGRYISGRRSSGNLGGLFC